MTDKSVFYAVAQIIDGADGYTAKRAAYHQAGLVAHHSGNHNVFLTVISALGGEPLAVDAPQRAALRAAAYRGWEGLA